MSPAESRYLRFERVQLPERKTPVVIVVSKRSGTVLGEIAWYGRWRQFCFYPAEDTVFNVGCLDDIEDMIAELHAERAGAQAFTVGFAALYDRYVADSEHPRKLGQRDGYPGGWVWSSAQDAREFLGSETLAREFPDDDPAGFAVYELRLPTGWEADVTPEPDRNGVHHLLTDALIVGRCHG